MTGKYYNPREIQGWVAKLGVFFPYLCRILSENMHGSGWLASLSSNGNPFEAFLALQISNAIVLGSIILAIGSYKYFKAVRFPILFGFAALAFGYCTNDLTPASTAGLGIAYVSLQALPAVFIGWILGRYFDQKMRREAQAAVKEVPTDFDLEKTRELTQLLAVKPDRRDVAWQKEFIETVRFASLSTATPQIISAPNGLRYFRLYLPEAGKEFVAFSVNHLLKRCTEEEHCGIAIYGNFETEKPEWSFPLGELWSYRMFDTPFGDPQDLREGSGTKLNTKPQSIENFRMPKNTQMIIDHPDETFLPVALAKAIGNYMRQLNIKNPAVALIIVPGGKPSRNLMFNISSEHFTPEAYQGVMENIALMLPNGRGLIAYKEEFHDKMQELPREKAQPEMQQGASEMPNEFDLEKTNALAQLFRVDPAKRDASWQKEFLATIRYASLTAFEPQTFIAPDKLIYFRLAIPDSGKKFTAFSVNHLLEPCTEEGHCGIAIYASLEAEEPEWVFSLGDLWSYRLYGNPNGDPQDLRELDGKTRDKNDFFENITLPKNTEMMIGYPSDYVLPKKLATFIARYMRGIGIEEPSVALIVIATEKPSRNLMFNIPMEKFGPSDFGFIMQNITWMLPRGRGIIGYKEEYRDKMHKLPE